jgi:glycopeptide antibiotics resistance protein
MKYDVGYITNYMIEYDSGVPLSVIIGISLIVCVIIIILYHYSIDGFKFFRKASCCILGGYLFYIFGVTILFRDKTAEVHYSLCPLWSYSVLYNKLLAQNILNVLMFIPIGFLVSLSVRTKTTLKIIGIGCALSLTIEILQLVTKRGVCNIDDVIHNTIGCAIGYGLYLIFRMIIRKALRNIS